MTLTQLRYLLAIADANLNISLAASRLNATQPGLSRQLIQIEEELGFQIFMRHARRLIRLTARGQEVIDRARVVLGEVHNIEAMAANHRRDTRGTLRIATTQTLGRFVLPAALGRLRARFSNVSLRLRPGGEQECLAMLERDEIDLALVSTEGPRPACDLAIPLFTWNRALVTKRDHPLANSTGDLTLAELARYPLVAAENATGLHYKLGRAFHAQGLQPNISCTARDADTIKTFVRHDLGVGLIAEMAMTPQDDDLVNLHAGDLFPTCTTWAIMRSDRVQRDYVFSLLHELAPALGQEEIDMALQGGADIDLTGRIAHWRSSGEG